jgi:hypothetical protein
MAAPKFPYPSDEWIGQPSDDPRNHSGCYGGIDTENVKTWQKKMKDRGWSLGVDGCYGPESEGVCRDFQSEKGLTVDGDVGPKTWEKTWSAPVTDDGGDGGDGGSSSSGKPPSDPRSGTDPPNRALKWMADHRGITEDPVNSNCDSRKDGIRAAQDRCAGGGTWLRYQPWCGTWCFNALQAAGGVKGLDSNMASVAWIESQARAGRDPFSSWTTNGDKCEPGDLVVLYGSGTHVGMLRQVQSSSSIVTEEGNTSVGSNGGSAQKTRSRSSDVYGYARVDYHGSS